MDFLKELAVKIIDGATTDGANVDVDVVIGKVEKAGMGLCLIASGLRATKNGAAAKQLNKLMNDLNAQNWLKVLADVELLKEIIDNMMEDYDSNPAVKKIVDGWNMLKEVI